MERRILAEIVGAVGVEAAGAAESEIDAPGEDGLRRRVVTLDLALERVGERFAGHDHVVDGDLEEVAGGEGAKKLRVRK